MKPGDAAINFSVQNNVTGDEFLRACLTNSAVS
jgi:hypothetical protein